MLTLIISILLSITYGQDACGNTVESLSPFNLNQFEGVYNQIALNEVAVQEFELDKFPVCPTVNYTLGSNEFGVPSINIQNKAFNASGGELIVNLVGLQNKPNTGEFIVGVPPFFGDSPNLQVVKLRGGFFNRPYRIALIYGCNQSPFDPEPFVSLGIVSRTQKITTLQYISLLKEATAQGLDVKSLNIVRFDRSDCPPN